ncbi:hypothetical protein J7K70_01930 [bacterium]|nr:hypothetical protein [bacterium]
MSSDIFYWTKHSQAKMSFYGLSSSRVKRVIRHPHRIEKGIAPGTIAAMQRAGSKKHPYEIWVMYEIKHIKKNNKAGEKKEKPETNKKQKPITIISAWKYPGKTKPGDPIPIPPEIFQEIIKNYN